jgi:ATP-dependent DNA ligase
LPTWVKPQLTRLVTEAPSGDEWAHELKFDEYRMHARLDRGDVNLLTRTGLDWTTKYPALAAALRTLPVGQAYLDGELCGVRPDGVTSFALIQNAAELRGGADLVYFVFDLLHRDRRKFVAAAVNGAQIRTRHPSRAEITAPACRPMLMSPPASPRDQLSAQATLWVTVCYS